MDVTSAGDLKQAAPGVGAPTPGGDPVIVAGQTRARLRASQAIALQLQRSILDGSHTYGEKLAPERDLAQVFKVSRTTVRGALQRLEDAGLVVRKVGSGTYVSYRASRQVEEIAEITSPLELIEVRLALEPQVMRSAIANATSKDLDRVNETLQRVLTAGDDQEEFSRWDEEFHFRLAECTHNPLLEWIYGHINEVRGHSQWNASKNTILTNRRMANYNREHRRIYESLCSRDVETSVKIITEHLERARAELLGETIGVALIGTDSAKQ